MSSLTNIINLKPDSSFTAGGVDLLYHSDYKCNGGSYGPMSDGNMQWFAGPLTWDFALGNFWIIDYPAFGFPAVGIAKKMNGISYLHSAVTLKDIVDGTSHTYLAGEKYCNPSAYFTGWDGSDDSPVMGGDDFDLVGWTDQRPLRDRRGGAIHGPNPFGSAHPLTFNMVYCDGSATSLSYEIVPLKRDNFDQKDNKWKLDFGVWKRNACRNDRQFGLGLGPIWVNP